MNGDHLSEFGCYTQGDFYILCLCLLISKGQGEIKVRCTHYMHIWTSLCVWGSLGAWIGSSSKECMNHLCIPCYFCLTLKAALGSCVGKMCRKNGFTFRDINFLLCRRKLFHHNVWSGTQVFFPMAAWYIYTIEGNSLHRLYYPFSAHPTPQRLISI